MVHTLFFVIINDTSTLLHVGVLVDLVEVEGCLLSSNKINNGPLAKQPTKDSKVILGEELQIKIQNILNVSNKVKLRIILSVHWKVALAVEHSRL